MKLSERAMLATLHRGSWSGTKHDQEVTEETAENHKADVKDAGRYSKQLISKKAMAKVSSKMALARNTHRVLTLPWDDDGTRILTAKGYIHYMDQMRLHRLAVEATVKEFIKKYPDYIQESKTRLGSMFNAEEYPSVDEVKSKFFIDVEIKPIPEASDFRTKLSDDQTKVIVKDIEARTKQRVEAAITDVFERILKVAGTMKDRLKDFEPKGSEEKGSTFRDSLVYNIKELADALPMLNVMGDARFDELAKQLNEELVNSSPEQLRSDAKLRKQAISNADRIMKKVKAYMP